VSHETTLGYLTGSDATQHVIAQYAREQARIAGEATLGEAGQHIAALNDFAEFLATRPRHDQRLVALYRLMSQAGDSETYIPGEEQARLFGMLGSAGGVPTPLPDHTLSELVAAAIVDHLSTTAGAVQEVEAKRDAVQRELEVSEAARAAAESASTEVQQLRDESAAARAEADSLREQVEHLRSMLSGSEEKRGRPTRKKLDGHDYIYYKDAADGERFYIVRVPEPEGKSRYETVGPDLDEALAKRDELVGRPAEQKEPVAA
jgi:hypothetical protein